MIDESKPVEPLPQIEFTLEPGAGEAFTVGKGANLFLGSNATIIGSCAGACRHERNPHRSERRWHAALRSRAAGADSGRLCQPADRSRVPLLDPETEQWNLVLLNAITAAKDSVDGGVDQAAACWRK